MSVFLCSLFDLPRRFIVQLAIHKRSLGVSNIVLNFVLFLNPNFYLFVLLSFKILTYTVVHNYTKIEKKYYIINIF